MDINSQTGKMCAPKDDYLSKVEKSSKCSTSKQGKTHKKDEEEFEKRRDIWLEQSGVPVNKRNSMISDITKLRSMRNIDITIAGSVTSFFLTYKTEQLSWRIVSILADMVFNDKTSAERLHKMVAWKFTDKYRVTKQLYNSKLTSGDLENVRKDYKDKAYKKIIVNHQPGPDRLLPNDLDHRKALEANSASPTAHTFSFGQSSSKPPSNAQVSSTSLSRASRSSSGGTIYLSAPTGPSYPSSTSLSGLATPPPSPFAGSIKRERSSDDSLDQHTAKKHCAGGLMPNNSRLNKEYDDKQAKLVGQLAEKQARIQLERVRLEKDKIDNEAWYNTEVQKLKAEHAQRRAAGSGTWEERSRKISSSYSTRRN